MSLICIVNVKDCSQEAQPVDPNADNMTPEEVEAMLLEKLPATVFVQGKTNFEEGFKPVFINNQVNDIELTITNTWKERITVKSLSGKLTDAEDLQTKLVLLPFQPTNIHLEPQESKQFVYKFKPDLALPQDVGLALFFDFQAGDQRLTNTAYNSTVTIDDLETSYDLQSIFLYLVFGALIGLAGKFFLGSSQPAKKTKVVREDNRTPEDMQKEWIPVQSSPKPRKRKTKK